MKNALHLCVTLLLLSLVSAGQATNAQTPGTPADKQTAAPATPEPSAVPTNFTSAKGFVLEDATPVKDWRVHAKEIRTAETGASTPEAKATAVVAADPPKTLAAKLAITSNPTGADIEIDGSFVGNTPSEIHVSPGDHTVSVSKAGFKPWQRNLKATGGAVSLSAELESEAK